MSNTATAAERWVLEIERHVLAQKQIMMDAASKCAPFKKLIGEAKAAAKNEGISVEALNALITQRQHLRNAVGVVKKLEDDDLISELEMLRDQVPAVEGVEDLWAYAREQIEGEIAEAKAKRSPRAAAAAKAKSDALDDLADDEFDRVGRENVTKLNAGIKKLN